MKKLVYIIMFAFAIAPANKIMAQDNSPDQNLIQNVREVLFKKDCPECIAQQNEITAILNDNNTKFKWGYETITVEKNLDWFLDHSEVVFGSNLLGRISLHSIENGRVTKSQKVLPGPMDKFLCFKDVPFIQIVKRKKIEPVTFDKDEAPTPKNVPIAAAPPSTVQPSPVQPQSIITNGGGSTKTTIDGNTITVDVNLIDDKADQDRVGENQKRIPYNGKEYFQKDNGWAEFGTGILVGSVMNSLLNTLFFRPNYYSTNVYGQPSIYGTNAPNTYGYWRN